MNKKISSSQAFDIWKQHAWGQDDHLSEQRLYQLSLDGGLANAPAWETEHLSLCPHCLDKWDAFCIVNQSGTAEEYEDEVLISCGVLKAASSGFQEPVSLPSQCRRFMLGIFPDMDDPGKGMAVLEIIGDDLCDHQGKRAIVKDAGNNTILKNIIRQGRAASIIDRLDDLDLSQWTLVVNNLPDNG